LSIMYISSRASASSSTNSARIPASGGGFSGANLPPAASSRDSPDDTSRTDVIGSVTVHAYG
jgi:hypothetical protein